jgi:hypothetical protein
MGTIKVSEETTRTSISGADTALQNLANVTYVVLGTVTHTTNDPLASYLEIKTKPGTVSGNKQLVVFCKGSLDGSNFESGPESGTTTTDEPNLRFLGTIPLNSNSTSQTKLFGFASAYPEGVLPYASKIVVKNDSGANLSNTQADHGAWYTEHWGITA